MFRLTHYLRLLKEGNAADGEQKQKKVFSGKGPITIWNLTRTCNLECVHCYASSKNQDYSQELRTEQAIKVLEDLKAADVFSLILSGGEPLYRTDLFMIARRAKELGFFLTLSTNGTLIGDEEADAISAAGFDYVGVSLDGIGDVHDQFRGLEGSFDKAVRGLLKCKDRGVRVGVRFTMAQLNAPDLPKIFDLVEKNGIEKLYLSHLVYSGRGSLNRYEDLTPEDTRTAMAYVLDKANEYVDNGSPIEIVTGNNEADAVYMLLTMQETNPEGVQRLLPLLRRWGGNSAGRGVVNIDSRGDVHPDPLVYHINLGNVVKTEFAKIWGESQNDDLHRLRERPRRLKGRCGECAWLDICNGASRTRAMRKTGDLWASDPACYISDEEISTGVINERKDSAGRPSLILNG